MKRVKEDLMQQLIISQKKALEDKGTVKAAKDKFKTDLFKTLSPTLFKKFIENFKYDIELFSYQHIRDKYSSLINAT